MLQKFDRALSNVMYASTSSDLKDRLIEFRYVLIECPLIRTFECRHRFVDDMNSRLPEWKRDGAWTKEVGIEYGNALREFTILKNYLRTIRSGILLRPRSTPSSS